MRLTPRHPPRALRGLATPTRRRATRSLAASLAYRRPRSLARSLRTPWILVSSLFSSASLTVTPRPGKVAFAHRIIIRKILPPRASSTIHSLIRKNRLESSAREVILFRFTGSIVVKQRHARLTLREERCTGTNRRIVGRTVTSPQLSFFPTERPARTRKPARRPGRPSRASLVTAASCRNDRNDASCHNLRLLCTWVKWNLDATGLSESLPPKEEPAPVVTGRGPRHAQDFTSQNVRFRQNAPARARGIGPSAPRGADIRSQRQEARRREKLGRSQNQTHNHFDKSFT